MHTHYKQCNMFSVIEYNQIPLRSYVITRVDIWFSKHWFPFLLDTFIINLYFPLFSVFLSYFPNTLGITLNVFLFSLRTWYHLTPPLSLLLVIHPLAYLAFLSWQTVWRLCREKCNHNICYFLSYTNLEKSYSVYLFFFHYARNLQKISSSSNPTKYVLLIATVVKLKGK